MGLFEDAPVIGKDLLEDAPMPPGFDSHQVAPSEGSRLFRWLLRIDILMAKNV
jgi:hypothetical protein